jgi:phosphoribosyl-ATP pyrophosphohydrolase/phosphoribosyl-AMP cyclohydrolase
VVSNPAEPSPLIPGIVQDRRTGRVLMVAYLDEEAIRETERTGLAHFWSRSRRRLWQKGETSGNTMQVRSIRRDCDDDTLLIEVDPAGPACHTGARSCFDGPGDRPLEGFAWLERLWAVIAGRIADPPPGSYTASLAGAGVDAPARKVIEEAAETALAAKDHAVGAADERRVAEEAADLLYHLLVLLGERRISPGEVIDVLEERSRA